MGRTIAIAVVAAALFGAGSPVVHAAGLGKLTVLSALGHPLVAEIDIVSLQPNEEEGLSARLASPEAFMQAGIEYSSALLGMRFDIVRREGRPVLRVTTSQPVSEPFVDLLVELQWNSGRLIREYTFLLDPPEYKAPRALAAAPAVPAPQAQAPAAEPAAPIEARPLPAPAVAAAPAEPAREPRGDRQYEVKRGDTLGKIAREHMLPGLTLEQMLIVIFRANEDAFIRGNVNLVREGRILNIPSDPQPVDESEARRLVRTHNAEFNAYRSRLAAAPTAADAAPGTREVTGRIEAKPEAAPPAQPRDQVRLSKVDPAKPAAPGSQAAAEDDRVAQERALKEAQERQAELEKNLADMEKLLALRNQQLAELQKLAKEQKAPSATEAPKPAAEAAKPGSEAAALAAAAPAPKPAAKPKPKPAAKKAPPPPPAPEPSLVDEFLENPLALAGLAGVVVLLGGYGAWAWRRKKKSQARFQDSVLDAASGAGAASVFGAEGAAAGADASQVSVSQAPAGMEAEEVDPIAEADVYMAYGRDAQAEEILKEAVAKDPSRIAVHAKLLEIYANRKDAQAFEQTALKLKSLTGGSGPEWEKAAALGRGVDPQNGLYGGAGGAAAAVTAAPAAAAVAAAAPALDFDIGGPTSQSPVPDIALDAAPKDETPSTIDFDLGAAASAPSEEKSDFTPEGTLIMGNEADSTASGGLDFDLGLPGETKPAQAPAAAAPAAQADQSGSDTSGGLDFDLNLDLGDASGAEKPAEAPAAMDLSSISLDLGNAADAAGGGDGKWQEIATKLDLAKAYEEMGDKDGARELLNEVVKDGDAAQKGQAQELLAKLG
ncbi:MAG TPA: FimV/HubP family polar landmark protein [Burkholderiales bacterium]|nr:FimV/HubP family polar landmark protein [Burkholderiales bacterium]